MVKPVDAITETESETASSLNKLIKQLGAFSTWDASKAILLALVFASTLHLYDGRFTNKAKSRGVKAAYVFFLRNGLLFDKGY